MTSAQLKADMDQRLAAVGLGREGVSRVYRSGCAGPRSSARAVPSGVSNRKSCTFRPCCHNSAAYSPSAPLPLSEPVDDGGGGYH